MDYEQKGISNRSQATSAATTAPGQELHELTPTAGTSKAHTAIQPCAQAVQQAETTAAVEPTIIRPETVYLAEPIVIKGMKVHYTRDGARYLKQHWQHIYDTVKADTTNKAEIKRMLENYDITIQLYANE